MIRPVGASKLPRALTGSRVRKLLDEAEKHFRSVPRPKPGSFRFDDSVFDSDEVKGALAVLFGGKCAYCESVFDERRQLEVDHFRPLYNSLGLDGAPSPDHYWWLAYDWENLLPSCVECAQRKGTRFPVGGTRSRPPARGSALSAERPLLLDPRWDAAEGHLSFLDDGLVASLTDRGRVTIDVLDLNRADLVARRGRALAELHREWDKVGEAKRLTEPRLAPLLDGRREFAGMRRQFVTTWASERAARQDLVSIFDSHLGEVEKLIVTEAEELQLRTAFEKNEQRQEYSLAHDVHEPQYFASTRWIERVMLHNLRMIDHLELDISTNRRFHAPWLMLLGENGTGKSSILQAIALALVGDEYRSRLNLDAASFVRRGSGSGYVEVALSGTRKPLHLSFSKRGFVSSDSEPKVLVLGYGATRLLARGTTAYRTAVVSPFARVENLFNPFAPLGEKVEWLFALPPRRFASVAEALRRILSLEQEAEFRRNSRSRRVEVEAYGVRVPLEHLSDGYQSVIALALDIMSVMLHRWPAMEVAEGIVLADELGAHLHPRWRMQIVKALREAFPRVQFVSSTHDPLCLRGMRDGEVLVLRRRPDGTVYPLLDAPPVEGLRVEQILTSEHFGLNSTVDPEIDELFERYYTLKGRWSLNAKEEKEHGELAARLDKMRLLGRTRRERIMLEAADEYLAVERRTESSSDRVRLQQSTKQKIAAMWRDAEPATEMEPQR